MKSLVVDASIALGAGGIEKVKLACRPCREFLLQILGFGHRLTWTEAIEAEWKNHAASFARKWRVQMFARRRVDLRKAAAVPGLCERILGVLANEGEREAARKDCHLLYAALESHRTVASLDQKVRRLFSIACPAAVEIREVVWVNPDRDEDGALEWIRNGAQSEPGRMLAHFKCG